ncbi:hypothetical protein ACHAQA_003559 [Verticillium albo-atrum]
MPPDNVAVTARCLCRNHAFTVAVSPSTLPFEATVDHSDAARHLTGGLYLATAPWPNSDEVVSALKAYAVSKGVESFSCGTCSAQMFQRRDGQLRVVTGVLGNDEGLVRYGAHVGADDTKDGGVALWFDSGSAQSERASGDGGGGGGGGELPAGETELRCHCGGVHLVLHGARAEDAEAWRDIVDPTSGRYLATLDACDSCRVTVGTDVVCWAFAPIARVKFADEWFGFPGSVGDLKAAVLRGVAGLGTMRVYGSSEGVERFFCGRCAASVFYTSSVREKQVDVAVGVLRRGDGARGDGALSWALGRADYREDVEGGWREGVVNELVEASERWRVERGLPEDFLKARGEA